MHKGKIENRLNIQYYDILNKAEVTLTQCWEWILIFGLWLVKTLRACSMETSLIVFINVWEYGNILQFCSVCFMSHTPY